jgi:hypothetical protein
MEENKEEIRNLRKELQAKQNEMKQLKLHIDILQEKDLTRKMERRLQLSSLNNKNTGSRNYDRNSFLGGNSEDEFDEEKQEYDQKDWRRKNNVMEWKDLLKRDEILQQTSTSGHRDHSSPKRNSNSSKPPRNNNKQMVLAHAQQKNSQSTQSPSSYHKNRKEERTPSPAHRSEEIVDNIDHFLRMNAMEEVMDSEVLEMTQNYETEDREDSGKHKRMRTSNNYDNSEPTTGENEGKSKKESIKAPIRASDLVKEIAFKNLEQSFTTGSPSPLRLRSVLKEDYSPSRVKVNRLQQIYEKVSNKSK